MTRRKDGSPLNKVVRWNNQRRYPESPKRTFERMSFGGKRIFLWPVWDIENLDFGKVCLCSFLPGEGSTGLRISHSVYPVATFPPSSSGDGLPDYLQLTVGNSVAYFWVRRKQMGFLRYYTYCLLLLLLLWLKTAIWGIQRCLFLFFSELLFCQRVHVWTIWRNIFHWLSGHYKTPIC